MEKWSGEPLFRLLAFLDVVGLQSFSYANELSEDGTFVNIEQTFSPEAVVRDVLRCSLLALRKNISKIFSSSSKQCTQVLQLIGEPDGPATALGQRILRPSSLQEFNQTLDDELPLSIRDEVVRAFSPDHPLTEGKRLAEQLLIDGIDEWMSTMSQEEVDAVVQACGVQPKVLQAARKRAGTPNCAMEDFIIDVVFPPPEYFQVKDGDVVVDWVIAAYDHCYKSHGTHEDVVVVDDEEVVQEPQGGGEDGNGDEVLLTSENVGTYLFENPSVVPKAIMRELRRKLDDPEITRFELQNHYLASELYTFVRDKLGIQKTLRKSGCIDAILQQHNRPTTKPSPAKSKRKRSKRG